MHFPSVTSRTLLFIEEAYNSESMILVCLSIPWTMSKIAASVKIKDLQMVQPSRAARASESGIDRIGSRCC